jgi:hypothetical protein
MICGVLPWKSNRSQDATLTALGLILAAFDVLAIVW